MVITSKDDKMQVDRSKNFLKFSAKLDMIKKLEHGEGKTVLV